MTCKPTTIAQKYTDGILANGSNSIDAIRTAEVLVSAQQNPVNLYDKTQLVGITDTLRKALSRSDLSDFPYLDSRLQQAPLIFTEVADFMNQSGFEPNTFEEMLNDYVNTTAIYPLADPTNIPPSVFTDGFTNCCNQLELYYAGNFANSISGGFCSAFGNPFGQLQKALALLEIGKGLLAQLQSFDPAALLKSLIEKLKIDALKDKLAEIVDGLKDTLLEQVNAVINQVKQFAQDVKNKVMNAVKNVQAFLQDFSMDKLKDKIKEFVDDTMNQFEELTPEAIALMLFRFCQFGELIQSFLKSPVDALKGFAASFAAEAAILDNMAQREAVRVAAHGGVRLADPVIRRTRERLRDAASPRREDDASTAPGDVPPPPSSYVASTELTDEENDLLTNMSDAGVPGYLTFNAGVTEMHIRRGRLTDCGPGDGWRRVRQDTWVRIMIVARRMGITLNINSAYRSPQYNAKLRGAARRSLHMSGQALDVNVANMSDEQIRCFIRVCSQEGFNAIQYYQGENFIHVDTGARRTWRSGGRFQSWILAHMRDEFRSGRTDPPRDNPHPDSETELAERDLPELGPNERQVSVVTDPNTGEITERIIERTGTDADGFNFTETVRVPV